MNLLLRQGAEPFGSHQVQIAGNGNQGRFQFVAADCQKLGLETINLLHLPDTALRIGKGFLQPLAQVLRLGDIGNRQQQKRLMVVRGRETADRGDGRKRILGGAGLNLVAKNERMIRRVGEDARQHLDNRMIRAE